MNNDFVSIRGKSLPRRMVLQGIASLLGGLLRLALLLPPRTLPAHGAGDTWAVLSIRLAVPDQTGWAKRAWRTAYYQWHGVQLRLPYPFAQHAN